MIHICMRSMRLPAVETALSHQLSYRALSRCTVLNSIAMSVECALSTIRFGRPMSSGCGWSEVRACLQSILRRTTVFGYQSEVFDFKRMMTVHIEKPQGIMCRGFPTGRIALFRSSRNNVRIVRACVLLVWGSHE